MNRRGLRTALGLFVAAVVAGLVALAQWIVYRLVCRMDWLESLKIKE